MPHDIEGLLRIKQAFPSIPLASGEDHQGRHVFAQMASLRCLDVFQPDLRVAGGLSEVLKIYALGEAAGISTIPHAGANIPFAQHFAYAMPDSPMAEFWLGSDPGVPLKNAVAYPGAAAPIDGKLIPSDSPGFGFEILDSSFSPWPS